MSDFQKTTLFITKYTVIKSIELSKLSSCELGKLYYQHDNARPHVHFNVNRKLELLGWKKLEYQPYSPDLAPSDYYLFLSLANSLKGQQFKEEANLIEYIDEFFASKSLEF